MKTRHLCDIESAQLFSVHSEEASGLVFHISPGPCQALNSEKVEWMWLIKGWHKMNEACETPAFWFGFKYQFKVLSQQKKQSIRTNRNRRHVLLLESIVLSQKAGMCCRWRRLFSSSLIQTLWVTSIIRETRTTTKKGIFGTPAFSKCATYFYSDAVRHCICGIVRRKWIFNVGTHLFIFSTWRF